MRAGTVLAIHVCMRSALTLAIAMAAAACAGPPERVAFEADDIDAIASAADQWNAAIGTRLYVLADACEGSECARVVVRDSSRRAFDNVTLDRRDLATLAHDGREPYAVTGYEPLAITFDTRSELVGALLHNVAVHELGHTLGLMHAAHGAMSTDRDRSHDGCVDAVTLAQYCTLYPCDGAERTTCS